MTITTRDIRCLCCGLDSIQKSRSHISYSVEEEYCAKKMRLSDGNYITCSKCKASICRECCLELWTEMSKVKSDSLNKDFVPFYEQFQAYIRDGQYDTDYIGSCCIIKINRNVQRKKVSFLSM